MRTREVRGADPSGKTDSAAAIQAAIDRAAEAYRWIPNWVRLPRWAQRRVLRARTVQLGPGSYRVLSMLDMRPGVSLRTPEPRDDQ